MATEWDEFKQFSLEKLGEIMKNKVVFDGRNIYSLNKMAEAGFYYESIGRPTIVK